MIHASVMYVRCVYYNEGSLYDGCMVCDVNMMVYDVNMMLYDVNMMYISCDICCLASENILALSSKIHP